MSKHSKQPAASVESPTDLTRPSWRFALRSTLRGFSRDQCTDLAAALTYYSVLSIFPAAIALLSLVGVFGQGPKTVETLLDILRDLGAGSAADTVAPSLDALSQTDTAGLALALGLGTALWSASAYVGAFGRAMNRIYDVEEGRPFWRLRPMLLIVTLVAVVLVGVIALALVVTGPAADAVGTALGIGSTAVLAWEIAKWPVVIGLVIGIVAMLYYATPNVHQPKFRWVSVGAALAIATWIVASAGFGLYVSQFGNYNKTYGALGGVIAFLLWLWITNLALLFGAELDAELERSRELQAGLPAEEHLQLEPRDTRSADKAADKRADLVAQGRRLRQRSADQAQDPQESVHAR